MALVYALITHDEGNLILGIQTNTDLESDTKTQELLTERRFDKDGSREETVNHRGGLNLKDTHYMRCPFLWHLLQIGNY